MTLVAQALRQWWHTSAPWSMPTVDVVDGLEVAVSHDGRPCRFPLGVGNLLVAGATGSGKSTLLRGLIADAAHRPDVALVALDLKGGVELGPWSPRLHLLATTQADARRALLLVAAEVRCRHRVLTAHQATAWTSAWGPWLVVVIDELAEAVEPVSSARPDRELAAAVLSLATSIARLGRASGVHLVSATQRPDAGTISAGLRGQHDWRIGLRMRDVNESRLVCPHDLGDLTLLAGGGDALWLPALPFDPAGCRARHIPPGDVPAIATSLAPLRPQLVWSPL